MKNLWKYFITLIIGILLFQSQSYPQQNKEIETAVEVDTYFFNQFDGDDIAKRYQVEVFIKDVYYEASKILEDANLNLYIKVDTVIIHDNTDNYFVVLDTNKTKDYYTNIIYNRALNRWNGKKRNYDFVTYISPIYNSLTLKKMGYPSKPYYGDYGEYGTSTTFSNDYYNKDGGGFAVLGFSKERKNLAVKFILQTILYAVDCNASDGIGQKGCVNL